MTETPAKIRQIVAWRFEAFAFDCAQFLSRQFPVDVVSDFGSWLARKLGPLSSAHRVAEANLRVVFPHAPDAEIARLLDAQWGETGRWFVEFLILDRIVAEPGRVEVEGAERLAALAEGGGQAVLISGHFSTFEVMSATIVRAGVRCQITYREANNPYVDRRIAEIRRRYGVTLFAPKGTDGARALLRALARGESVALMNDQKFNGGVAAPFFGLAAYTAPGPASFALRFGIPIQPMSVQRREKARFKVIVHEPFRLTDTGNREADIRAGVMRINAFMEERILARPTEWFWVHRRWPNELYKRRN
jgi:KDO2-lipid IV(A) lauroyltransferase